MVYKMALKMCIFSFLFLLSITGGNTMPNFPTKQTPIILRNADDIRKLFAESPYDAHFVDVSSGKKLKKTTKDSEMYIF